MYNRRYKKCCCQKNYNEKVIEDICDNVGTKVEYKSECHDKCSCMDNNNCNKNRYNCECGFEQEDSVFPENPMFGQSYVPIQKMNKTFTPCVGLKMGTIFPELVSPYFPCQSIEENAFIKAKNEIGEGCNR